MSPDTLQLIAIAAIAGVILVLYKNVRINAKLNYLRSQHTIHNNILINNEKDIAELNAKMNAVAIDIGGLYIAYSRFNDRLAVVEDHLGITPEEPEPETEELDE